MTFNFASDKLNCMLLKTTSTGKPDKQLRVPNKNQKMFNNHVQGKAFKVKQYMASRTLVRQGALAQRRSNFQGSHFPIAKDFARKAAVAPLRNSNRPFNNNAMSNPKKSRKMIGASDPQKSEPETIRGDLAVVVGRNIIHGSDGQERAKDKIKPEELVNYTSSSEKSVYGDN